MTTAITLSTTAPVAQPAMSTNSSKALRDTIYLELAVTARRAMDSVREIELCLESPWDAETDNDEFCSPCPQATNSLSPMFPQQETELVSSGRNRFPLDNAGGAACSNRANQTGKAAIHCFGATAKNLPHQRVEIRVK